MSIPALIALATFISSGVSSAGSKDLSRCPAAVRATIESAARGGRIDDVDRIARSGAAIYIAEIDFPGDRETTLHVAADGIVLRTIEELPLAEAPPQVRTAIDGLEGSPDDLERITGTGSTTYHVEMDRRGLPDLKVVISGEGAVLSRTEETGD